MVAVRCSNVDHINVRVLHQFIIRAVGCARRLSALLGFYAFFDEPSR